MICEKECLDVEPSFGRFLYSKLITAVPVATALVAVFRYSDSLAWPLIYVALCLIQVNVMYYFKCPHCPYYEKGGFFHKCFMMWGFPKIYKKRTGPTPSFLSKYVPVAILVITLYPVYWLLQEWELLLIYALSWGVLVGVLADHCARCIYFECKFNSVPDELRKIYLGKEEI